MGLARTLLLGMHPVFHPFGHEVPAYGVLFVAALAASLSCSIVAAPRFQLDRRRWCIIALAALASGLVGAKLGSVFLEGAKLFAPVGFTCVAGLVAGAAVLAVVARLTRQSVPAALDVGAVAAALGLAIGRIGCLLGGCCWGRPTLFAIAIVYEDFSAPVRPIGVPLHATQLYESVGSLLLFGALLVWTLRYRPRRGMVALVFMCAYGALRFLIEFLRADPRGPFVAGLPAPQLAALLATGVAVALLVLLRKRPVSRSGMQHHVDGSGPAAGAQGSDVPTAE